MTDNKTSFNIGMLFMLIIWLMILAATCYKYEIMPERILVKQKTYTMDNIVYKITIDTVKTDSIAKSINWRNK